MAATLENGLRNGGNLTTKPTFRARKSSNQSTVVARSHCRGSSPSLHSKLAVPALGAIRFSRRDETWFFLDVTSARDETGFLRDVTVSRGALGSQSGEAEEHLRGRARGRASALMPEEGVSPTRRSPRARNLLNLARSLSLSPPHNPSAIE